MVSKRPFFENSYWNGYVSFTRLGALGPNNALNINTCGGQAIFFQWKGEIFFGPNLPNYGLLDDWMG